MKNYFLSCVLVAIGLTSVLSKNVWEYFSAPEMYFQGEAIAWVLVMAVIVNRLQTTVWPRKWALILFWWAVSDVIEMFVMDRAAFDWNEYITAALTVLIIICTPNGGRKKRTGRMERTGYK